MRFRTTCAGLLAVFLLVFSCASSACAARCDLQSLTRPCHGSAVFPAAPHTSVTASEQHCAAAAMPAMHHSAQAAFELPSSCHRICKQQVAQVNKNSWESGVLLVPVQFLTAQTVTAAALPAGPRLAPAETPPARIPSLIQLQTTLRV